MQFHVNVSSAKDAARGRVVLSVRVRGIECGIVRLGLAGKRVFGPTNRHVFRNCDADAADGCEWGEPAVKRYIEAVDVASATAKPEAEIEAALVVAMKKSGETWRGVQQPVCLAGLPFQVPLPVAASSGPPKLGDGHIDVLARVEHGARALRVYEVKAPGAPARAVRGALAQAVVYAAALRRVLGQGAASEPWWRLIGFDGPPVRRRRFEAWAVVEDTPRNREIVEDEIRKLCTTKDPGLMLDCLYYSRTVSGGAREFRQRQATGGPPTVATTPAGDSLTSDAQAEDGMTLPLCMDCGLEEPATGPCPHWLPSYWKAQGYVRNWGDAAVMAWPRMEILRRETPDEIDYVILAPGVLRIPLHIYVRWRTGTSWGMY